MPFTSVFVTHKDKSVKVKFTNFESLIRNSNEKFKISNNFRLEYQAHNEKWIAICDDDDLEDILPNAELRLVLEEKSKDESFDISVSEKRGKKRKRSQSISREGKEEESINQGGNHSSYGAATSSGNAQNVGGDVSGNVVGGNYTKIYYGNKKTELKEKDIKQSCKTYKRDLLEYARDKAVKPNLYYGSKVSIVKLQITSNEQQIQNIEGIHLHHREGRAELMSEKIVGDVEVEELFEKAKELAEEKALEIDFENIPNAREKFIKKEGNLVIISGQAGSGKTTLSKTVLGKIVGEEHLFDIDFVFYAVLREVDYGKKLSLLRFLAPTVSYDSNQQKAILSTINDCDKVLIIMDGLDESNVDFTTSHLSISLDSEDTAEMFIKNLLNRTILPNAKKLIFSRPRAVADLPDQYKAILVATILGLNHDAQLQICNDICKERSKKVYQSIKNNANLLAYCQTPLNLILTAHAINETALNKFSQIHTFTDVLTFTLQWLVDSKKHHHGNFDAKSIAALAWNGFKNDKFTFTQEDFKEGFNTDNFFVATNKINLTLLEGKPEIKVCFSHLVLQEFFAALHLLYFMELQEFLENSHDFIKSKFEIVTKIMFGLCSEKTKERSKKILSSEFIPEKKISCLKSLVRLEPYKNIDEEVLRYFLWAYELNDDSLTEKIASCMSDRVYVSCRMLPSDIAAFHYVCGMRKQQSITFQRLSPENFYEECWNQFLSDTKLHQYLKKMEELNIEKCEISDDAMFGLFQCTHNIQRLVLNSCSLRTIGWMTAVGGIANMSEKMEELNIEKCEVSDDAMFGLFQCTHNIQRLVLNSCSLTTIGWKKVFDGIANMDEKMEELKLINYLINEDRPLDLFQCIHKIQRLVLDRCGLTTIGWKTVFGGVASIVEIIETFDQQTNDHYFIATLVWENNKVKSFTLTDCVLKAVEWKPFLCGVANLEEKMEELQLERCEISDDAALGLAQCTQNIQHLFLYYCKLTTIGWKAVFGGVTNMNEKMETSDQQTNENYVKAYLVMENNVVKRFDLSNIRLITREWKTVFNGVANLEKKMEVLVLYECGIIDDAALGLAQCTHNIQRLVLHDCKLTTSQWKTVFDGVTNMNEKMEQLQLVECKISDDATLGLAQCTHNIQRLVLYDCKLTRIGWKTVFDGVTNMNEKLVELTIQCKPGELTEELVEEYKARLESKVTNLTINIKPWDVMFARD